MLEFCVNSLSSKKHCKPFLYSLQANLNFLAVIQTFASITNLTTPLNFNIAYHSFIQRPPILPLSNLAMLNEREIVFSLIRIDVRKGHKIAIRPFTIPFYCREMAFHTIMR